MVVGIGASDPPVLLFATSGSTSAGPPPAKPLSSLQPDADASECPPMRIHMSSEDHTYTSTCTWIMNGKEWKKKKGIPGRGFSKAPRSEWSAGHKPHYTVYNRINGIMCRTMHCVQSANEFLFDCKHVSTMPHGITSSESTFDFDSELMSFSIFLIRILFPRQRHGSF